MAKKGAALEQLVALIQETLKDKQDATISTNKKEVDETGISREIDVLVCTHGQGLPFNIAFECKEYSKKSVDVQVVDAFIGKCKYLPQLHRKVIVSTTGFSDNAIKRAKEEDIILCTLEDLPLDMILSSTEVFNPIPKFEFHNEISIEVECPDQIVDGNYLASSDCFFAADDSVFNIYDEASKEILKMPNLMRFAKRFMEANKKPFDSLMTFRIIPNYIYVRNKDGEKCFIRKIIVPFLVNFEIEEGYAVKKQKYNQGEDVVITESRFENNDRPFSAVVIESGEKRKAVFKIDDQYIEPSIKID